MAMFFLAGLVILINLFCVILTFKGQRHQVLAHYESDVAMTAPPDYIFRRQAISVSHGWKLEPGAERTCRAITVHRPVFMVALSNYNRTPPVLNQ